MSKLETSDLEEKLDPKMTEDQNTTPNDPAIDPDDLVPEIKHGLAHRLHTGELSFNFVGRRNTWYLISAVVLVLCALTLIFKGLNLGIEFKGGSQFQAPVMVTDNTVDEVRKAVLDVGLPSMDNLTVTTLGEDTVQIQTRALEVSEVAQVRQVIAEKLGLGEEQVTYSLIGPSWGKQVTEKSLVALVVFIVLASVLMTIYFRNWKMSLSAMVALAHDMILTVGIYSLIGFTVSPATVIGMLTILGYSLYDTVVVFDMVREHTADIERKPYTYSEAANKAVNQVLIRSVNTTIIGVLPVIAIVIMGAFVLKTGPLEDLGVALLVGMLAGAYSSIFIATPMLTQLKEREPEMVKHRETLERKLASIEAKKSKEESKDSKSGSSADRKPSSTSVQDSASVKPRAMSSVADSSGRIQPRKTSRSQRKK